MSTKHSVQPDGPPCISVVASHRVSRPSREQLLQPPPRRRLRGRVEEDAYESIFGKIAMKDSDQQLKKFSI